MTKSTPNEETLPVLGEDWFDPLEAAVRSRLREVIETLIEEEPEAVLGRSGGAMSPYAAFTCPAFLITYRQN